MTKASTKLPYVRGKILELALSLEPGHSYMAFMSTQSFYSMQLHNCDHGYHDPVELGECPILVAQDARAHTGQGRAEGEKRDAET